MTQEFFDFSINRKIYFKYLLILNILEFEEIKKDQEHKSERNY